MKLQDWMIRHKMSDEALAEKIGVTRTAVNRFKRGVLFPSWATMIMVAGVTKRKVMPNDFLCAVAEEESDDG